MSQDTTPYQTQGDEALEARIVAWVLDEASPFEVDELKRLCTERPELEIFRRRIHTIHHLLDESENQKSDPAWQLDATKRADLDATFGKSSTAHANVIVPKKRRTRMWMSAAASIAILIALSGLFAPMVMMQRKSASGAPMHATYSAEMADYETDYPDELIAGTPVPITPQSLMPGSQARTRSSSTASPTPIPVPEMDIPQPSVAFGDTSDFGGGWGEAELAQNAVPTLGDTPMAGRLFAGEEASSRPPAPSSAKPRVAPSQPDAPSIASTESTKSLSGAQLGYAALEKAPEIEGFLTGERQEAAGGFLNSLNTDEASLGLDRDAGAKSKGETEGEGKVTANDDIRAGLLAEVDEAWKLAAPQDAAADEPIPVPSEEPVARARELRSSGKYEEAREILEPLATTSDSARRELESLEDPIRTNPANGGPLTQEHAKNIEDVRRNLYTAEGNFNLGKFDDAKKAYEETLRIDPYNQAARRGLERVAARKSDYYRAAYDHTRAELLAQVDGGQLAVPAEEETAPPIPSTESIKSPDPLADLSLPELVDRINALRAKIDDPTISESRPQAWITELQALQKLAIEKSKAAQPPPAPENETSAAADPFSTFSLNVSDAAFVIARDAIRRGERPAPEQVRVEQFYNALDYGDPAPAAGEVVATQIEQAAHPVLPGRNLVRIAARVGSTGRAATQPLHLTLLVDQSGSMVRADRQAILEKTLATLATLLGENDVVHVIGFARQPRLIAEALPGNRANEIRALVHQAAAEGGTNMETALELAQQIAARHQKPGAQNRVVFLSDGAANLGDADPTRLAERITQMRQQGIATDIAGIGSDGLNDALLAELARHGDGRYHIVTRDTGDRLARDLAGAFRPAASDVKVQVVFNPERVGGWKLIGFEEHRLNTEDFRNDAVDAAELAAEEAGVAIYQVETLPQGRGEIGEVFVRFRDAATGRIVERSWPLPYDANAPALGQARPSMQLATLAMLTAEKLRGGPLGDAIDLSTHRPLVQALTTHYRHDPRAQELFEMVSTLTNR